jgi:hypothetical protein
MTIQAAASTSETLVNIYQITHYNTEEESHLHTHHHENLKSYSLHPSFSPADGNSSNFQNVFFSAYQKMDKSSNSN